MVERVGETCSAARAQVGVRTRSAHPRCARSTAGSRLLPATPWIGRGRLGGKGQAQWGIGGPGIQRRGDVDRRRRGRTDPVGAKAGKEGRDIARVREREIFEGAVVVDVKTQKLGGDRVGFGVVKEGGSGDKEVKVFAMVVFDSKVINHQRKDDVTGDVTKETGGGSLVEAVDGKMGEKTVLGQLACLL